MSASPHRSAPHAWIENPLVQAPAWCSVDLRDGNQALPVPLSPRQKRRYLELLLQTGFREIEIGFPTASQDDWQFTRDVITERLLPEDAWMSVLIPAREDLVLHTLDSLRGCRQAILHLFIATSPLHRRYVLGMTPSQLLARVRMSVSRLREVALAQPASRFRLEFSPEEFSDSEMDFVLEVTETVFEAWHPADGEKIIFNLPCTVERSLPTRYADQVAEFVARNPHGAQSLVSIHTHNDMGTGIAAAELALQAGAQRVEGTLFGNGERAGNLDLTVLAINLQAMGIPSGLDFSRLESLRNEVAALTRMPVSPRHPYAGALAFTAFSGTHQDAISKGLEHQAEIQKDFGRWKLPYTNISPETLGRSYQKCIRINSQSGRGGLAFVLHETAGVTIPEPMLADFSQVVQHAADASGTEMQPAQLWSLFRNEYCRLGGPIKLQKYWPRPDPQRPRTIHAEVHVSYQGKNHTLTGQGEGPVSAFGAAIRQLPLPTFRLETYEEHALGKSVNADSISILSISDADGRLFYGVSFGTNIVQSAAEALTSALNRMLQRGNNEKNASQEE